MKKRKGKEKRLDAVLCTIGWQASASLTPSYQGPYLVRYRVAASAEGKRPWSVPRYKMMFLMEISLDKLPLMIAQGPSEESSCDYFHDADVPFFTKRLELGI